MNTTNKTLLASFVIVALAVAAPMAAAQVTFTFGSMVKLGDSDFAPTLAPAGASTVCRINLGDTASLNDDQFVLDFAGALAPANDQVRLLNQGTAKAGTLIGDDAASGNEKASGFAGACTALALIDIDVDGDGVWGPGDYLYIDTAGVGGVTGAAGVSAQDIRLTVTSGGAAGTITKPGDSDVTAFGTAGAAGFGPAALAFWDQDLDAVWSAGDGLYGSTGVGPLAIVHDVRLVGGSGAFGSFVKLGDADFAPTLAASAVPAVCRINLGDTASLNDDQFVLDFTGAAAAPANDQVRSVNQGTSKAGTLIGDDAASGNEKASGFAGACTALVLIDIDVDGDGVWGSGDYLYIDTAGVGGVTGAAGVSAQDIRLTVTSGGAAGTITKPGDSDVTAFGAAVAAGFGPAAMAFWDQDLDAVWSAGDGLYASTGAGPLAIVHDVRLVGASGAFGSFVKLGDADFASTLAAAAVPAVCRINLGDTASLNDDQFVLDFTGAAAAPANDQVRVANQGTSKAGTLIGDDAASGNEKASGFAGACTALVLIDIDVDGDGVWGPGDYLYIDTAGIGGVTGGAGVSAQDIRLTVTSGGAAGTITKPGDSDVTAFGAAVAAGFGVGALAFWDQDLDGVWSAGDGLYASSGAGPLAIVHDVRLTGVFAPGGGLPGTNNPGTTGPGTTGPGTTGPGTTGPGTTGPGTTAQPTSDDDETDAPEDKDEETPGFELVALLAALGAALVLVRRKL